MKKSQVLLLGLFAVIFGCKTSKYTDLGDGLFAAIQTTKGDIIVRLEYDKTPVTVANFVSLAEGTNPFVSEQYKGRKYYKGVTFHRVIKDFMIQEAATRDSALKMSLMIRCITTKQESYPWPMPGPRPTAASFL